MNFYEASGCEAREREQAVELKEAFNRSRNWRSVSRSDRRALKDRNHEDSYAANRYSRTVFSRAICDELQSKFCSDPQTLDHDQDVFFLTLLDIRCATDLSPVVPDLRQFKAIMRRGLRGLSYVGMMDVAYYANLAAGVRFNGKRCLFWHLHALVWGVTEREMKRHIRLLNRSGEYLAIIDGLKGVLSKKVKSGTLPIVAGYVLKSPANAYRVWRKDRFDDDGNSLVNADGEILAKFGQKKSKLRHGERVRLFKLLKQVPMTDLAISGGEGKTILARAKRSAAL